MKRFLVLLLLLCSFPVFAADGVIGFSGQIIDAAEAEFNPMAPKNEADPRYPPMGLSCHYRTDQCFTGSGRYIGTLAELQARLPPLPPEGIADGTIVCDRICFDYLGRVVGAAPKSQ